MSSSTEVCDLTVEHEEVSIGVRSVFTKLRRAVFPFEAIALIFVAFAGLLYLSFGVSPRDPLSLYIGRVRYAAFFYAFGIFICYFIVRLADLKSGMEAGDVVSRSETWVNFKSKYLNPSRIVADLRMVHCVAIMFVVFVNLKHLIPLVNSTLYDSSLLSVDRALFAGQTAGQWLQGVLGTGSAVLLSHVYTAFYGYTAFFIFVMALQRDLALAREFFCAFLLIWFLGILTVYVLPTWGPCFYVPELYVGLPVTEVTAMQKDLWRHHLHLSKNPLSDSGVYLISGLPSLHLAVPLLGVVYLKNVSRLLTLLTWVFVYLTTITTLYFGWHYILDDVASVVLVGVAIIVAKNFNRLWSR